MAPTLRKWTFTVRLFVEAQGCLLDCECVLLASARARRSLIRVLTDRQQRWVGGSSGKETRPQDSSTASRASRIKLTMSSTALGDQASRRNPATSQRLASKRQASHEPRPSAPTIQPTDLCEGMGAAQAGQAHETPIQVSLSLLRRCACSQC
eukprot:3695051-Rhodomonas_salina.4